MGIFQKLRTWARKDDGSSTIEFCIWLPFILSIVGSSFEGSLLTTRQIMLNSAVDRVVRDLQLGNLGSNPSMAQLKWLICNTAGVIMDCNNSLHIEMERISTTDFEFRKGEVACVDKSDEDFEPLVNFTNGTTNDLMLITVCAAVHPMVPLTGLGMSLPKIRDGDHYAIIAFSAFVVEPV